MRNAKRVRQTTEGNIRRKNLEFLKKYTEMWGGKHRGTHPRTQKLSINVTNTVTLVTVNGVMNVDK
jgi:hypothetical protein